MKTKSITRRHLHQLIPHASPAGRRGLHHALGLKPTRAPKRPAKVWQGYRSEWEWKYAQHLTLRQRAGEIRDWAYEPDRLVLAPARDKQKALTYTPDFRVVTTAGDVEYHEVKGYQRRSGVMSFKIAAAHHPQFRWVMVSQERGRWVIVREYAAKR